MKRPLGDACRPKEALNAQSRTHWRFNLISGPMPDGSQWEVTRREKEPADKSASVCHSRLALTEYKNVLFCCSYCIEHWSSASSSSLYAHNSNVIGCEYRICLWSELLNYTWKGIVSLDLLCVINTKCPENKQQFETFPHDTHFCLLIPTFISGAWTDPPPGGGVKGPIWECEATYFLHLNLKKRWRLILSGSKGAG